MRHSQCFGPPTETVDLLWFHRARYLVVPLILLLHNTRPSQLKARNSARLLFLNAEKWVDNGSKVTQSQLACSTTLVQKARRLTIHPKHKTFPSRKCKRKVPALTITGSFWIHYYCNRIGVWAPLEHKNDCNAARERKKNTSNFNTTPMDRRPC